MKGGKKNSEKPWKHKKVYMAHASERSISVEAPEESH